MDKGAMTMGTKAATPNRPAAFQRGGLPPYSRILVPLDGSPLAEEALPAAMLFARRAGTGSKLILLYVSPREHLVYLRGGPFAMPPGTEQEITAYLARQAAAVSAQGVAVETVRTEGEAALGIIERAQAHYADLILLVTHAREGSSRLVHGSVADRVLQEAPVPVLLLRHGEQPINLFAPEQHPQLLLPLDGSALAESVLLRAMALAQQLGATVTLLRSLHLPELQLEARGRPEGPSEALQRLMATERQAATRYLEQVQQRLHAHGISATLRVTEGSAAEDIAEQARGLANAGQATLIVMATHGRGGSDRWLYGSVAGAVLHLAEVPLLVIRPH
jgi:nucleotide-binding universal stress UspA family protein